jgi:hypothetical protein
MVGFALDMKNAMSRFFYFIESAGGLRKLLRAHSAQLSV